MEVGWGGAVAFTREDAMAVPLPHLFKYTKPPGTEDTFREDHRSVGTTENAVAGRERGEGNVAPTKTAERKRPTINITDSLTVQQLECV
jgi:hypothetical protein